MDYARLKFEQYAEQLGHKDFERDEFGNYRNPFMQGPWNFWRASRDALPSAAAQAPVGYCMEGENHCVCGGDLPRVREGCANWRKVAAPVAPAATGPTHAEFALQALVAAGHVTQSKVDEAIEIARKTLGVAPLAAAWLIDWRGLLAAVLREARQEDGYSDVWKGTENAPGHAHEVAGIWDSDNRASIADKPCSWCLAWNAARVALATTHGDKQ